MSRWALIGALCAATAVPALRGEDVVVAAAIRDGAREVAGDDLAARAWLDAARVNARVAPWQPGWGEARACVREVAEARRAALPHLRGGRRRPG